MHFITFSREMGTNGTKIARQVAEKLNYRLIDTEAIDNKAREMGFLESVEKADEKPPSLFQRFFSHKPSINLDRLSSVIYELAEEGNAVFIGRGGQMLLKSFNCALHVRVIASRQTRIKHLVERGYTQDAALKEIERSDQEKSGFIKFAFGVNWEEPSHYDIILNMDKLSVNLAVDTVLTLANSSEIKACKLDSLESLGKLALAHKAEAALTESGVSYGLATSVTVSVVEPGKVQLTGVVEDKKSKIRAEEVLKMVKGVESINNQIRVQPEDRHA